MLLNALSLWFQVISNIQDIIVGYVMKPSREEDFLKASNMKKIKNQELSINHQLL